MTAFPCRPARMTKNCAAVCADHGPQIPSSADVSVEPGPLDEVMPDAIQVRVQDRDSASRTGKDSQALAFLGLIAYHSPYRNAAQRRGAYGKR